MPRIAIVVGSTRPGRRCDQVARWVYDEATTRSAGRWPGVEFAMVDLAEVGLPLLDEPAPAALGPYRQEHTRRWSAQVAAFDGFVFVTPEYNHGVPAALKNAIDYLFVEWHDKAAGFVSYGFAGGVRAVEQLRLTLAEVKVACVRSQVALNLFSDFTISDMAEPGRFTPADHHGPVLKRMLDEVVDWSEALAQLRRSRPDRRLVSPATPTGA
jgi:NAD(P)H-dependent FMN reductase